MSAYTDGLHLLGRRELSAADLRTRLLEREHTADETDAAIRKLIDTGALDDRRVAGAYARTAAKVKGRGRLRVTRELQAMGIAREVVAEAVAEVYGDVDERALIDRALEKKRRGGRRSPVSMQERARLYQFLMRQGFTPAAVSAALRRFGRDSE